MIAFGRVLFLGFLATLSTIVSASERSDHPRYVGVNAFLEALSVNDRDTAIKLVVALENSPRGNVDIPSPDVAVDALLGCKNYENKYALSAESFPMAITKWQCADKHYKLWVRPSYDGQPGKVQIVAFLAFIPVNGNTTSSKSGAAQ